MRMLSLTPSLTLRRRGARSQPTEHDGSDEARGVVGAEIVEVAVVRHAEQRRVLQRGCGGRAARRREELQQRAHVDEIVLLACGGRVCARARERAGLSSAWAKGRQERARGERVCVTTHVCRDVCVRVCPCVCVCACVWQASVHAGGAHGERAPYATRSSHGSGSGESCLG
eukprot:982926-Prymnesium_polylepis.1